MPRPAVARLPLVDAVTERLRQLIADGELRSGDRLPAEPELIHRLGVSRSVLREAIQRLQALGLVTVRHGSGTFVAAQDDLTACAKLVRTAMALSSAELVQFAELREAIEVFAARQACVRATVAEVTDLGLFCEELNRDTDDWEGTMERDFRFHLRLVALTGNTLMQSTLRMLQEFILEGMRRTKPKPSQMPTSRRYHRAIVEAIAHHDSAAAEAAIHAHMNLLIRRLQEGNTPKAPSR